MKARTIAFALAWTLPSLALAQGIPLPAKEVSLSLSAFVNAPAKDGAGLTVTSPAVKDFGDMPIPNTERGGSTFPGLSWAKGPPGTKTYAIVEQDTDGWRFGRAILHWSAYNYPAGVTTLAPGQSLAGGAKNGPNIRGPGLPYRGPGAPQGVKHRYRFQVFALDTVIPDDAAQDYAPFVEAMKGHVLASGQLVTLGFLRPGETPPPPPSPPPRPPGYTGPENLPPGG